MSETTATHGKSDHAGVVSHLRACWVHLREGRPGQRFERMYLKERRQPSAGMAPLMMGLGILSIVAGAIMLVIPGPGMAFIVVGAFLIARHSRRTARALDYLELAGRRVLRAALSSWRSLPRAARGAAFILAGVVCLATVVGVAVAWL